MVGALERGVERLQGSHRAYKPMAFLAFAAIGSASFTTLKEINRAYRLLPSASFPVQRENQTAASNLLLGERRVNTWPFHSTAVTPSASRLRTVAPIDGQSKPEYSLKCRW
jgi:hypothetical protein